MCKTAWKILCTLRSVGHRWKCVYSWIIAFFPVTFNFSSLFPNVNSLKAMCTGLCKSNQIYYLLLDIILEYCFLMVSKKVVKCFYLQFVFALKRLSTFEKMHIYRFLHTWTQIIRMPQLLLSSLCLKKCLHSIRDVWFAFFVTAYN